MGNQFYNNKTIKSFEGPNLNALTTRTFCNSSVKKIICDNLTSYNGAAICDGCTELEEVYLPECQYFGGQYAMRNCTALKRIELPKATKIEGMAVLGSCTSLESIILPSCTHIGNSVWLTNSTSVKELVIGTSNCTLTSSSGFPSNFLEQATIYVPDDSVETYKSATNWSTFADIIKPISQRTIDLIARDFPTQYLKTFTFSTTDKIKDFALDIPENVTSLANSFENARKIQNIILRRDNEQVKITNISNAFAYPELVPRTITIEFDTSKVTNYYRMCHRIGLAWNGGYTVTINGNIDFSSATDVRQMFDNLGGFSCKSFVPNSLFISWRPGATMLDDETRQSVIDCLAEVETTKTLTLTSADGELLTEEQIVSATAKGWTIAY